MTESDASTGSIRQAPGRNRSKILRHDGNFGWQGIALETYKLTTGSWRDVTRRELVGRRGESTDFHVRYFEIAPGGHSTEERHRHEHVVIPLRGRGIVQLGSRVYRVGFGDVIYVAPADRHQFRNADEVGEPFGFLCIVDAQRDHPRSVDGTEACGICD